MVRCCRPHLTPSSDDEDEKQGLLDGENDPMSVVTPDNPRRKSLDVDLEPGHVRFSTPASPEISR